MEALRLWGQGLGLMARVWGFRVRWLMVEVF